MKSTYRLKENRDFRRVFQRGRSVANGTLVLYWYTNRLNSFRVGFSISKKVGNAVVRNRIKRRLRACFLQLIPKLEDCHMDLVIVCRKSAANATYDDLWHDVMKLLRRGNFMV